MRGRSCRSDARRDQPEPRRIADPGAWLLMPNPESPWLRFLVGLVATALALDVAWRLLLQALPLVILLLVGAGLFVVRRLWRDRGW